MEYQIRRHPRAKKMRLKVDARGSVTVVLPRFVPTIAGRLFAESNRVWIEAQRQRMMLQNVSDPALWALTDGDFLPLFDVKSLQLRVEVSDHKSGFLLEGDQLKCWVKQGRASSEQAALKVLLEAFYRDQARAYLTERVEFWTQRLGVEYRQIRIKNTKSRWGSCSSKGNLNFSWRIMLAPKAVVDYLVIHEVCHLLELNHSTRFWNLVADLDPDFKSHKQWLKNHQTALFNFLV